MLLDPISELPMNNKQTADHINSFFSSLTNDFLEVRGDWLVRGELDSLPSITDENVAKRLSDLTVGKAAGPYDPYIKLIKMFAKYFAIPLAYIYNESFMSRIFPQIWKFYAVCAIPKITPCSNVEDLRPISLTSVLSKVQESYVVEWVHEDIKGKVREAQFGGLPGSSAVLALVRLAHNWYSAMENSSI